MDLGSIANKRIITAFANGLDSLAYYTDLPSE